MAHSRTYGHDDNPIDWSGFNEGASHTQTRKSPVLLRAYSSVLLVLSVVGLVIGCLLVKSALDFLGMSELNRVALFTNPMLMQFPLLLMTLCVLNLIPACIGLQQSSSSNSLLIACTLGGAGVLVGLAGLAFSLAASVYDGLLTFLGPWPLWAALAALALAYFLMAFFAHRKDLSHSGAHASARGNAEDALWDDEAVWGNSR